MKRSQKSNRVSWAPDVNLCQVRLFSSEDFPSNAALHAQDHFEMKASRILHSNDMDTNALPPGFENSPFVKQSKEEPICIPQIEWNCPPKFVLSPNWHVAAGEESKEAEFQKLREMRVLEAVYPRLSAIPPSPSVSLDVEECRHADQHTPLIPVNPIEEDCETNFQFDNAAPVNILSSLLPAALAEGNVSSGSPKTDLSHSHALGPPSGEKQALGKLPGFGADLVVAASAAFTALMKSKEKESLIDTDLLIEIISNPEMVGKLLNDYVVPKNAESLSKSKPVAVAHAVPVSSPQPNMVFFSSQNLEPVQNKMQPMSSLVPPKQDFASISAPMQATPLVPLFIQEPNMILPPRSATGNNLVSSPNQARPTLISQPCTSNSQPSTFPVTPISAGKSAPVVVKDINYYKDLIRQHGGESQDTHEHDPNNLLHYGGHQKFFQETKLVSSLKQSEIKRKIQKPCMYFSSPRGCRNGSNCRYLHDLTYKLKAGSKPDAPSAKRMKLSKEYTERTEIRTLPRLEI